MSLVATGTVSATPVSKVVTGGSMSAGAEGAILAVPAGLAVVAVAGIALATVAVAGVGIVAVREGSRLVLGCGRQLSAAAMENLESQRKIRRAASEYESQLRMQAEQAVAHKTANLQMQNEARREQRRLQISTLLTTTSKFVIPLQNPIEEEELQSYRDSIVGTTPPPPQPFRDRISGWHGEVQRMSRFAQRLEQSLENYQMGIYQGLFRVEFLRETLQKAQTQLAELEDTAVDVDETNPPRTDILELCQADLEYIYGRLQEFQMRRAEMARQRQTALESIEQAATARETLRIESLQAEDVTGVEVVDQALQDAATALSACQFIRAHHAAHSALTHLQALNQAVDTQRLHNLLAVLEQLRSQVEPLRELPSLAATVDQWLEGYRSCEEFASKNITLAWERIQAPKIGLADRADALHERALTEIRRLNSISTVHLIEETLKEMGHVATVEGNLNNPDDILQITGERETEAIIVTLGGGGELSLKMEGYEGAECQYAYDTFVNTLQEKGLQATWQQKFTLSESLQRLTRLLKSHGLNVKIEPTHNGYTVLANGNPHQSAMIDFDGRLRTSAELEKVMQKTLDPRGDSYTSIQQAFVKRQQEMQARRDALRERAR